MRRSALILLVLACFATATAQAPRIGIAYVHVALDIRFGDAGPTTFELSGSIYPKIEIPGVLCPSTDCPAGFSTPFGYVYSSTYFDRNPHYHTEEILHLRQWEALGPAYLAAYVLTQGEPFEPYDSRSPFPASAAKDGDWWRLDKMWVPPPDMEHTFTHLRVRWGDGEPQIGFLSGYTDVVAEVLGLFTK